MEDNIIIALVSIVIALGAFLLLRSVNLWYWKINKMSSDIRDIKDMVENYMKRLPPIESAESDELFSEGTLVVNLETKKQMRVTQKTEDGKYKCYSGLVHIGDFEEDEIMAFDKWEKENL